MSNSKLSKQGQVVSLQDTLTIAKTKLGRTKSSSDRGLDIADLDCWSTCEVQ